MSACTLSSDCFNRNAVGKQQKTHANDGKYQAMWTALPAVRVAEAATGPSGTGFSA